MLVYFILLLIPFLFYFVRSYEVGNRKYTYIITADRETEKRNYALQYFFFILLLLLIFRAESVGNDTKNYHYIFDRNANMTFQEIFLNWEELLFYLFNYVLYKITDNYRFYLFIVALIEIIPIAYYYCKDKTYPLLKIAIFVNMSTFVLLFSGIRQAMSIALGVLAFYFLTKNKKVWFWVLAVAAFLIHTSGFMVFFLYPIYYIRLKKKHLLFIIPSMLVVYIFNKPIFRFLTSILMLFSDKFDTKISQTGALATLLMFVMFVVFSYIVADEEKMDDEAFALRNVLVFAVLIQCFAPLHVLAMRMNYYFIIFIPIAMSKTLACSRDRFSNLAKYGEIVMTAFFILYFCYTVVSEYVSGNSALNTVPYEPFWAEV